MKKLCYIFICLLGFSMAANAACGDEKMPPQGPPPREHCMKNRPPHMDLEKRLNLTDEQVSKARANRMESQKQIRPIMEKMKAKCAEIDKIKSSSISDEQKLKQIKPIRKEMRALRKEANVIREKNMKNFEALLTDVQKEELKAIKEERKEMNKHRP